MRAGRLKDQVTIEKRAAARHAVSNEIVDTWVTHCEPWCEVVAKRGAEVVVNNQVTSRVFYRFRCRFDDVEDVTDAMRVNFEGKLYQIITNLPDVANKRDAIIECVLINGGT